MNFGWVIVLVMLGIFIGYKWGWIEAHLMVQKEILLTGSFFVGPNVYECKLREQDASESPNP